MKYMTGDELATLMKDPTKQPGKDYLVIDVRDDDFQGGNIVGCVNKPSREFLSGVDSLVKDTKEVPLVIFHCALSQVRGPKAARIYEETRQHMYGDDGKKDNETKDAAAAEPSEEPAPKPKTEVAVLHEGFTMFQVKYKDDPKLVENYDEEFWKYQ